MKTAPSIRGSFLVWEPVRKSPPHHILVDSNRPSTTIFKYGRLIIGGDTIFLQKNRNFIRALAFIAATPVWGGLVIGLGFLSEFIARSFVDAHPGLTFLFASVVVISAVVWIITRFIKPLRRQFPRSQIANVRLKHLQPSPGSSSTRAGSLGIDFSVIPPDSFLETAQISGSIRTARLDKCSFVTFIALAESEAKSLLQQLPTTRVALAGNLNPDIPPQCAAPNISTQTEAKASGQPSGYAGIITEKRYSHDVKKGTLESVAVINAIMAFIAIRAAVTNHRGLIINGITLGPTGATIFYCLAGALFSALSISLAAVALRCVVNPHSLLVGLDGVTFFKGWFKPNKTFVPFHSIDSLLQQQSVKGGSRTLMLIVKKQRFAIHEAHLENRAAYEEIGKFIESSRTSARKASSTPPPKKTPDDDSRYMPKT